jgi:hypothetical protein
MTRTINETGAAVNYDYRTPNERHANRHRVTRVPKDHILVDQVKNGRVTETVYYSHGRNHMTYDINKAKRLTREVALEKQRSWGGEVKYNP